MKITRKDTTEGIKFHSELNPKLWENERLRPEVSDKLKQIALAFIDSLDIPIKPKDVVITGSSANYNYTRFSDIDLHVIVDYTTIPNAEEFFYAKKALWNKEHDITVRGFDVELYVEDSKVPANSTAVWSLRRDRWSRKPEPIEIDVDHASVRAKANFIVRLMQDMENSLEDVQRVLDRIYRMRQSGLERGGEFSTENLAFKVLRNKGVLDTLKDRKRKLEDRELSLEARTDELDRDLLTKVQNNVEIGKRAKRGPQIEALKKYQRDIVEDHLRALGYNEPVSHGSWGSVFPLPNYVVKIFSINDAAYLDFLKYVMENQNNPHLPKILKLPYRIPKTDLVLVRLEKLERYTKEQMPQVRGAFPQLAEVISEINRIGQSHGHYEDVDIRGTTNIMLRNGVPVIIDPWYQRGTSPSDPNLPVRGSKRPQRTGVKELDREPLTRLQRTRDAIVKDPKNSGLPEWMYRNDLKDDGSIDLKGDIYIERQIIIDFLRDNFGVKPVSSGGFASVYQTHKGVVKLFTARDVGYLGYLNFIAKNPHNPHVPKLLGKPRKIPGTRMMFVRMEPLIEPSFNVERVLDQVPSFRETFEFLRDNVPRDAAFDMETYTDRNYMLRADGTPVITDPWSTRNIMQEERTDELNRKPLTKYQRQRQDAIDNPYDNDLVRGVPDRSSLDDTGMKLDVEGGSFHQTERDMLQRFLFKIGVTRFRSGVRGDVFMAPNYAVKVYSGNDRAYQAFHKLALQHQDNPHLPKFKGRPYRIPGTSLNVVRMEKLQEPEQRLMDYFQEYPDLKETYEWLLQKRGKHIPDLHGYSTINFMLRADGTPVITDPWGGPGGPLREDRVDELNRRPLTRFQKEIKDQRDRIINGPHDDPSDADIPMDDGDWSERQQWALKKFLQELGVETLGSGGYATVFQIPGKPYVVKVFSQTDAGYAEYLRMIPELRKGPYARFVPKILGNPYPIPETKLMAIRMEKLLEWDKHRALQDGLDEFIDYLRKHTKKNPAIFSDLLFGRNIMLRADGTPVVIDPYGSNIYGAHEVKMPRKVKEARVDELDRSALTRFQKERKALLKRKKSDIDNADDEAFYERKALTDFLKDNFGIERIGKGSYAAVYEVPGKPFVVKVFSRLDRGYISYLRRIPAYRKSEFAPFVPRVMGTPVRIPGTGLAMVRLEKLTRKFQRDAIPQEMYPVWERFLAELERVPNEEVSHIFGDLFDKNVMMRADGTPVMLDPWGSDAEFHHQVPRSGIRELNRAPLSAIQKKVKDSDTNRGGDDEDKAAAHLKIVKDYLEEMGIKVSGGGSYSNIYDVPGKPFIVKLFFTTDAGYIEYLKMIPSLRKSKFSMFIPRILSNPYVIPGTNLAVVRVEKLTTFDHAPSVLQKSILVNDEFMEFVRYLNAHAESNEEIIFADVSEKNIAFRGNTPVVIDPWGSEMFDNQQIPRKGLVELNRRPLTQFQKKLQNLEVDQQTPVGKYPNDSGHIAPEQRNILKKHIKQKYKVGPIGTGVSSTVYDSNKSNTVVKIFDITDRGYVEFLNFCKQNRDKDYAIHLPKFYGKPYRVPDTDTVVVKMEKLTKKRKSQKITMDDYPTLVKLIGILKQKAVTAGLMFDLHNENIMMRDNVPVIIDPWNVNAIGDTIIQMPETRIDELERRPLTQLQKVRNATIDDPDSSEYLSYWDYGRHQNDDGSINVRGDVTQAYFDRMILSRWLKKNFGVDELASGSFATTYHTPKGVVKVFSAGDRGYQAYLQFIQNHRDNPHVPKVLGKPRRIPQTGMMFVRLETLRDRDLISFTEAVKNFPQIGKLFDQLYKLTPSGCFFDMEYASDRNFMWRGEVPVITDPWGSDDIIEEGKRRGMNELERRPLTSLQKQIRANLDSDPLSYAGDKKGTYQRNHLLYHLEGLGIRNLAGNGNWASVYEMPNYVAKVFSIQDKAYLAFLDLVQNGPGSPHLPKILKLPYRIPRTNLGLVRLEKLHEISEDEMPEINRKYPEFKEFMKQILAIGLARGFDQDIEPGDRFNVMKRADGTPVIIDPWYTKYASAREPLEDMPLKGSRRVREARTRVSELDRKSLTGLQQKLRGAPRVNPDYRGLEQAWRKDQRRVLTNHLRSLGWNGSAGSGHWANVFVLPNYAVKVFSQYDRAYLDFIRYAMQHQDNPHLPKILKLPYRIPGSELVAVRLEKLEEFPRWNAVDVYNSYPDLRELVNDIHDLGVNRGHAGDVVPGQLYNLMQRPDGTPVITDPWYTDKPDMQEPEGVSMRDATVPPETKKKVRMRQNPGWTKEDDEILRQLGENRVDELDRKTLTAIQQRIRAERDPEMKDYEGFRERRAIAKEIAERYGFRVDARGNWASVYVRKNDVVKVFSLNDVAYRGYLKYAMENQDNPYIPKVLKKPYRIPGTMVGVVRLERLKSPDNTSKEYAGRFPAFASLLAKMRYVGTIQGHVFDILPDGANNFMLRVDGTPVITDPWYTSDHSITPDDVFGDTSIEPVPNQLRQEDTQNLLDKLGQALEGLEIDRVDELDRSPLTRYQKFVKDSPAMDRNGDPDAIGFQEQRILRKFLSQYGINRISDGLYADVFVAPDGSIVKVVRHTDVGYMSFLRMFREVPEEFQMFLPKLQGRPYDIPGTSLAVFRMERLQEFDREKIDPALIRPFGEFKKWLEARVPAGCHYDLTRWNMMLRPDGTPVATDPYAPAMLRYDSKVSARDIRDAGQALTPRAP